MMLAPVRTLALCADDFGLSSGISVGIARLARAQRLSAVSCITNTAHWATDAHLLKQLPASVDVGLHFNLTEGAPLSPQMAKIWQRLPALPELIARAYLGLLPLDALRHEIQAQVAAFIACTGVPPIYLDGHQHVHHLPGLRDIVLGLAARMQPTPAIRNTGALPGSGFALKRWLIRNTGGKQLARELAHRGFARNPALLGVYDFQDENYRARMQGWLAKLPPEGGLIFCHPGAPSDGGQPDAIAPARKRELAYLESDQFALDLDAARVQLGSVWKADAQAP